MLLIHIPKITNRIGYTLNVVFHYLLRIDYTITTDTDTFLSHNDAKLCYGSQRLGDAPFIKASDLLFQTSVEDLDLGFFSYNGTAALFPVYGKDIDLPFDPLAAIFYTISRYEEYLPHITDEHDRFSAHDSVAFKYNYLQVSIVDRWALLIRDLVVAKFPSWSFSSRTYDFEQTVDIDAAYSFKNKGLPRTIVGFLRDGIHRHDFPALRQRLRVIFRKEPDPYDTFNYILSLRDKHKAMHLVFFVLLGDYSNFDKPISYHNAEFRTLIQHLGDYAKVGIHPSYSVLENPQNIEKEAHRLETILHRTIVRSRFHFLRFHLPESFRGLLDAQMTHDYSMGFPDEVGFRAGTCTPYPFYDLESDQETDLILHPFAVMDTTLQKYQNMSPAQATEAYKSIIHEVRSVNGTFCAIWHNQNLCESDGWEGWRAVYEQVLDYADPKSETFS